MFVVSFLAVFVVLEAPPYSTDALQRWMQRHDFDARTTVGVWKSLTVRQCDGVIVALPAIAMYDDQVLRSIKDSQACMELTSGTRSDIGSLIPNELPS